MTNPGTSVLTWKHFPAGPNGFFRAPTLITGPTEAILIDGGFTFPDGRLLAEAVLATGKHLTTIYISQSDPDYYFSLRPIVDAFPDVQVMAASQTVAAIQGSVEKKLSVWGPQLKENGPQTLRDIVIPKIFDEDALTVDGKRIEIVGAEGLDNRRYLWMPSLEAVFGGVLIFAGVHVWVADTATKEARAAWIVNLRKVSERKPAVVIPGHMTVDSATDVSAVEYTISYLSAFEEELANVSDSASLISAMNVRFPGRGMDVALSIGAKVAMGEMQWG